MNQLKKIAVFGQKIETLLTGLLDTPESQLLQAAISKAPHCNRWHSRANIISRLQTIAAMLQSDGFIGNYNKFCVSKEPKNIGIVSEEHIPLEEFPGIIAMLLCGHTVSYKETEKTDPVLKFLLEDLMSEIEEFRGRVIFSGGLLSKSDALYITSREQKSDAEYTYFKAKNVLFEVRHQSVAILDGKELDEEFVLLSNDVFNYFGQGCGNVRKIFVPVNYDVRRIFEAFETHKDVLDANTYANNYQYHQSVYLMNRIQHFDNGFLLLKEDEADRAPTGVLYYSYYESVNELSKYIETKSLCAYVSCPVHANERAFGDSANQLLFPSKQLADFLK